jgi:hypothetical protein
MLEGNTPLDAARTVCFRVTLPYGNEHPTPHQVADRLREKHWKRCQWIPQTMGDQVWLWYEFASVAEKEFFMAALEEDLLSLVTYDFTQEDLNYWKDINGTDAYERPITEKA